MSQEEEDKGGNSPTLGPNLKRTDSLFLVKQRLQKRTEKLKEELEKKEKKKKKNNGESDQSNDFAKKFQSSLKKQVIK